VVRPSCAINQYAHRASFIQTIVLYIHLFQSIVRLYYKRKFPFVKGQDEHYGDRHILLYFFTGFAM
jgi:hypothetical protein